MSEASDSSSQHPDMGPEFRDFAAQYGSLAEVWQHCPHADWMLRILYKCKYRNAEKLESYIDWLSEQISDPNEDELWEIRRRHFNYEACNKTLEEEVNGGKPNETEVRRYRFNCTWITAHDATRNLVSENN